MMSLAVLLLCGCGGTEEKADLRTVRAIHPLGSENQIDRHLSGMVAESHEISLGFKTAGQLNNIYVKEGDYVREGTLLATLDASDYEIGAEGLRAQASQLKAELERCRLLYDQKSMSLNDWEKIKAGYAQLESQLKSVENKIAYTKLYSPVGGHIQSVNFSKAEMVDAGTPVFNILDDTNMEIVVNIPVSLYRELDNILSASTTLPSTDAELPLQILSVVAKADGNQLYKMRLGVPAKFNHDFTPGMNADIKFTLTRQEDLAENVCIPAHALLRRGDSTFVWTVSNDSILRLQQITVGDMTADGLVKVTKGLSGVETIVVSGVNMLSEGEKVRLLQEPTKTNVGGML